MSDQVVLISGAAGRIGSAVARNLVSEGGRVVLMDVNASRLEEVQNELSPEKVLLITADASKPLEVEKCIAEAVDRFGQLDAAVYAAYPRSSGWGSRFEDLEAKYLYEDLSKHLGGAILFSQKLLAHFMIQGRGHLIHVSSVQGVRAPRFEHYDGTGMVSPVEYSAIKSGLIAITEYLAKYYKGNNIRVNCISPGGILDQQSEVFLEKYRAACNDKGMLEADDLVGTVSFLLSSQSRFITGQNIIVDDGWSL